MMWELAATVFIASLAGSVHCVGMCGPFVALTTLGRSPARRPMAPVVAYNLGRGAAYAAVGALAGTLGLAIDGGGVLAGVQRAAATLAGLTMTVIGAIWLLDLTVGARTLGPLRGRLGSAIARRLRSAFERSRGLDPIPRAAMLGVLTTFMPCGWLYAFAITAAGTGSPFWGAVLMLAFWAGSVPLLTIFGKGVQHLSPLVRRRLPLVMAALVFGVGIFTLLHRSSLPLHSPPPASPEGPQVPTAPPCHAS